MKRSARVLAALAFGLASTGGGIACEGRQVSSPALIDEVLCVPDGPSRIVTLDPFYTLLMAGELNLPVIGTALSGEAMPTQVEDSWDTMPEVVGQMTSPNLEAILRLDPDLIIGDAYSQAEIYGQLSEIAPTALVDTTDWKEYFRAVALVADAGEAAEAKLDAYEARVAETAAALPDEATVSFLRIIPGGFQVYVAGPAAYAPMSVLTELGIERPPFETATDDTVLKRPTMEGLLELEGDILIYTIGGAHHEGDAIALENEVTSSAIWQALPSVQNGRAYRVKPTHWMGFGGLASAHAIVDDVREIFGLEE
ncbi:MAG: iron-siderophore ABC transporter substrate-binding protein [Pseudomonadota bacterium]